jgi:hypothetical protein
LYKFFLAYLTLEAAGRNHLIDRNDIHEPSFDISKLLLISQGNLLEALTLVLVMLERAVHQLSKALLDG